MKIKKPKGWRTGQTLFNFLEWLAIMKKVDYNQNTRMADPFHLDDDKFDAYYQEFLDELKVK